MGKGGVDLIPSDERSAPAAPAHLGGLIDNPESRATSSSATATEDGTATNTDPDRKLLPRETGHDIGSASPVPLSAEAVGIIRRLRDLKDKDEDWARWRDVAFRGQGALVPHGLIRKEPKEPKKGRRVRRGKGRVRNGQEVLPEEEETAAPRIHDTMLEDEESNASKTTRSLTGIDNPPSFAEKHFMDADMLAPSTSDTHPESSITHMPINTTSITRGQQEEHVHRQLETYPNPDAGHRDPPSALAAETKGDAPLLAGNNEADALLGSSSTTAASDASYCPECFLPLPPDPPPEKLYIFLHALRYTTSLGMFETDMPVWAREGYTWQTSG